jgi:hypothetical protein
MPRKFYSSKNQGVKKVVDDAIEASKTRHKLNAKAKAAVLEFMQKHDKAAYNDMVKTLNAKGYMMAVTPSAISIKVMPAQQIPDTSTPSTSSADAISSNNESDSAPSSSDTEPVSKSSRSESDRPSEFPRDQNENQFQETMINILQERGTISQHAVYRIAGMIGNVHVSNVIKLSLAKMVLGLTAAVAPQIISNELHNLSYYLGYYQALEIAKTLAQESRIVERTQHLFEWIQNYNRTHAPPSMDQSVQVEPTSNDISVGTQPVSTATETQTPAAAPAAQHQAAQAQNQSVQAQVVNALPVNTAQQAPGFAAMRVNLGAFQ